MSGSAERGAPTWRGAVFGSPDFVAFALSVLLYWLAWSIALGAFPDRVPIHFGPSGDPDRWADRGTALVTFAILGFAMATLFGAVAGARFPVSMLNIPHKTWWIATPDRIARLRALLRADGLRMGAATMVLLAVMLLLVVQSARLADPRLTGWFFVVLVGYLGLTFGYVWHMYRSRYRPEAYPELGGPDA